jgi:glycerol-3-phosphate dehydrogenase
VPRLFEHDHAYIFQNADQRIIFAIPYEGAFTLIGTTEVEVRDSAAPVRAESDEIDYLCAQVSRYFQRPVRPADVVWTYSGVRPLIDDEHGNTAEVTRDYRLELDGRAGAPLLNVWGGKITTFRKLAQEAADLLAPALGRQTSGASGAPHWTDDAPLPGGDLSGWIIPSARPDHDIAAFDAELARRHPELPPPLRQRWVRSYGARVALLLAQPLGAEIAPGLHAGELQYLHDHEWARSADDVLWRRSKLGLHLDAAQREAVDAWCRAAWGNPGA